MSTIPALALNIDRQQASLEGLTPKTIVDSVITAMTSNGVVAPSYWIDPKTGNNYMLTVQYPESQVQTLNDFKQIPLRSADGKSTTPLETVASIKSINTAHGGGSLSASARLRRIRHAEEGRSKSNER